MKRSEISDEHVMALARQMCEEPLGPGLIDRLVAEGVPYKVALAKVEHMVTRRLLDYGVSPNRAWPNDYPSQEDA